MIPLLQAVLITFLAIVLFRAFMRATELAAKGKPPGTDAEQPDAEGKEDTGGRPVNRIKRYLK
ncbi:MAG: hypothetical protein IT429_20495 [Gemmataceae bacterium]|nr:hypothetical protein [Gemmataceae bacterium]